MHGLPFAEVENSIIDEFVPTKDPLIDSNSTYFIDFANFVSRAPFNALHININRFTPAKQLKLSSLLASEFFDIIFVNENWLEENESQSFGKGFNYSTLRRDRNSLGGGFLIFIHRKVKILSSFSEIDFKSIHLQIQNNCAPINFICSYKPPSQNESIYLDFLEDFIFTLDLSLPFFIVGDLNMDLLTSKGSFLKKFF